MLVELNRTKQANYQNQIIIQILNKYHENAVIFHSGSCSCNNWKLMTLNPVPAETLTLLPESTPVLRFVYTSVANGTCGSCEDRQDALQFAQ